MAVQLRSSCNDRAVRHTIPLVDRGSMGRSVRRVPLMVLALVVVAGLDAQPDRSRPGTIVEANLVQLSTSNESSIWGGQLRATGRLHERMGVIGTVTMLPIGPPFIIQSDLRMRFWGGPAGAWHPAFAVEFGYLFQNREWLVSDAVGEPVHGAGFGGTWLFPLAVVRSGSVVAKWAYVFRANAPDMTVFNCFVQWDVADRFGVRVGGDIYRALAQLKYSGFTAGVTYRL